MAEITNKILDEWAGFFQGANERNLFRDMLCSVLNKNISLETAIKQISDIVRIPASERDPMLPEVLVFIAKKDIITPGMFMRRFTIGMTRAKRILKQLETLEYIKPMTQYGSYKILAS